LNKGCRASSCSSPVQGNLMRIIPRAEAKASGATRYFTGNPCKYGHIAERSTVNGTCLKCLRLKQSGAAYTEKRTVRRRASGVGPRPDTTARKLAQKNGDKTYSDGRVCRNGHAGPRYTKTAICVECANEHARSDARREYTKANSAAACARVKAWILVNPGKVRAIQSTARARRRSRVYGGDNSQRVSEWFSCQEKVCYWCASDCENKNHIDHIFALANGGRHVTENMAISCPSCNLRKGASDPVDFARKVGRTDLIEKLETLRRTLQF
jgi:5-methylcytosine-specific restriction endonuclease McrA